MDLTMRIAEFEWREADHNQFSGRTSSILARGRAWSKKEDKSRIICSSGVNLGWFYADVPDELNELIKETNQLVIIDLSERNVIPKQWPAGLLENDAEEYPFKFKLAKTVLVSPNWAFDRDDSPKQSYVEIKIWSDHHGAIESKCDLELPNDHIYKAFEILERVI